MQLLERFETVNGYPAVYDPDLDALILADLHLGIEVAESYTGTLMPKFQLEEMLEEFAAMQEETGASRLVVDGDIKQSFSSGSGKEREEIERFLDKVSYMFEEVLLVEGNHDAALHYRVEDYTNVELADYFLRDGVLFLHGHERLDNLAELGAEMLVMGHEHPSLALKDEIGVTEKLPCFLYGEMKDGRELLVLPAFSHVASGTTVNEVLVNQLLSPILREDVDVDELQVVGVDREAGLFEFPRLGKLREL